MYHKTKPNFFVMLFFLEFFFTVVGYQVFPPNINNLHTVV